MTASGGILNDRCPPRLQNVVAEVVNLRHDPGPIPDHVRKMFDDLSGRARIDALLDKLDEVLAPLERETLPGLEDTRREIEALRLFCCASWRRNGCARAPRGCASALAASLKRPEAPTRSVDESDTDDGTSEDDLTTAATPNKRVLPARAAPTFVDATATLPPSRPPTATIRPDATQRYRPLLGTPGGTREGRAVRPPPKTTASTLALPAAPSALARPDPPPRPLATAPWLTDRRFIRPKAGSTPALHGRSPCRARRSVRYNRQPWASSRSSSWPPPRSRRSS